MYTTVTPSWAYTLRLPHDPRSAGIARSTLRAVLRSHGMDRLTDTAELLTSELVSNAYRHSRGPCALRVRAMAPERVRVGVWDTNPAIPAPFTEAPAPPGPDAEDADDTDTDTYTATTAEDGRGLLLVRLCAERYGAYRLDGAHRGKLLWVECGP
ncbi:ATP-binding protein [Streptomyces sp. NBC_01426]|uniref:ATP-binding protein n=1 Tax=Streptomyces sp. NBC_01426 TaxID=2975866 RepID=UPI002E33A566|nr:ATP-binding protein [Streptomyces sp. NBC_01426]